ncbi:MAG TPA: type II toxin-antitoxin system HicA family toxin [Patescibacteria group bacterium]|nr:type II toxin-antitoxin system HicA family toxin [Patescibacteria group bacterium]
MPKLPVGTAKQLIKILKDLEFTETRQKGSHKFFKHTDGRVTSVPFHAGDIGKGLLRKILNQIKISPEELRKLIEK